MPHHAAIGLVAVVVALGGAEGCAEVKLASHVIKALGRQGEQQAELPSETVSPVGQGHEILPPPPLPETAGQPERLIP